MSYNDRVEMRYVEDGNIQSVVINPWNGGLHAGEEILWNMVVKLGIIRKKVYSTRIVTNYRIMNIDGDNRLLMSILVPSIDDIIVTNTRRESESMGYGFFGGRYASMAGPFFSSGTSKTVGTVVFIVNARKLEWVEVPDPTGLKNFIKSLKKTMYDPLTKLESKRTRAGACPQCGVQNPRNAQFCSGCGSQLLQICSNCKGLNHTDASFCNKCGSQLGIRYEISLDTPTLSGKGVSEVVKPSFNECKLSEYNVKIDYPSTWTRIYNEENPKVKAIFQFQKEGAARHATVFVGIDNTIGDMNLDKLIENKITAMRQERMDFKLIESTPSRLSGIAAHQIIFSVREIKCLDVTAIKDNVSYWVMYTADPEIYFRFLSLAKRMISSFEILN
jgi:ribosomal protein L40E